MTQERMSLSCLYILSKSEIYLHELLIIFVNPATPLLLELASNKNLLHLTKLKHFTQTIKTNYKIQNKRLKEM